MPASILEWEWFLLVVMTGYLVSRIVQYIFMEKLLEAEKVTGWFKADDKVKRDHTGTMLHGHIGRLENILYPSAVVFDVPAVILVWFATKYVVTWNRWTWSPMGRTFYNRSLFGSGLNILLGVVIGGIAKVVIAAL